MTDIGRRLFVKFMALSLGAAYIGCDLPELPISISNNSRGGLISLILRVLGCNFKPFVADTCNFPENT